MNQWTLRNGVDSSHSKKDGPKPAKNGLCPGQLRILVSRVEAG